MPTATADVLAAPAVESLHERSAAVDAPIQNTRTTNAKEEVAGELSVGDGDFDLMLNSEISDKNMPVPVESQEDRDSPDWGPVVPTDERPTPLSLAQVSEHQEPVTQPATLPRDVSSAPSSVAALMSAKPPVDAAATTSPLPQSLAALELDSNHGVPTQRTPQWKNHHLQPIDVNLARSGEAAGNVTDESGVLPSGLLDNRVTVDAPVTNAPPNHKSQSNNSLSDPQETSLERMSSDGRDSKAPGATASAVEVASEELPRVGASQVRNVAASQSTSPKTDNLLGAQQPPSHHGRPLAADRVANEKHTVTSVPDVTDHWSIGSSNRQSPDAGPFLGDSNRTSHSSTQGTTRAMLDELPEVLPTTERNYGFRLDPPGMGRIWVQVKDGQRGIEARLEAQSEIAHQLITTNLDALRVHLENVGVELGELSLGLRHGDRDSDGKMPFQDRGSELPDWSPDEAAANITRRISSIWNGKLNVLA